MTDEFKKAEELFWSNFIYTAGWDVRGSNQPLASIKFTDGKPDVGFSWDGIIDLALYIEFLYIYYHYTLKTGDLDKRRDLSIKLYRAIKTLRRLSNSAYSMFSNNLMFKNYYLIKEDGFLLRDDISSSKADKFGLNQVQTSYTGGYEMQQEDPCHSMFISQDQIWNLLPVLRLISKDTEVLSSDINYNEIVTLSNNIAGDILSYVIDNNHVIYNPYYSAILHTWKYLVPFDVNYYERINYRNGRLKYNIKVKRGANNWYYSYGFRKSYSEITGDSDYCNKFIDFISAAWYYPFTFLADKVWFPLRKLFTGASAKDTSYNSLAVSSGVWAGFDFYSHLRKKFEKSLEDSVVNGVSKDTLFMPQLIYLQYLKEIQKGKEVKLPDMYKLSAWLSNYKIDTSGDKIITNNLNFMILSLFYEIYYK